MCFHVVRQDAASRELLISQLYLYSRENLSLVRIFIKDPYVTKLRRDEAFSIILFVAGAGGWLGHQLDCFHHG